jgi:hypothetical protein
MTKFWAERWSEEDDRRGRIEWRRGGRLSSEIEERGGKKRREEEERVARRFKLVESCQPACRDSVAPPAMAQLVVTCRTIDGPLVAPQHSTRLGRASLLDATQATWRHVGNRARVCPMSHVNRTGVTWKVQKLEISFGWVYFSIF